MPTTVQGLIIRVFGTLVLVVAAVADVGASEEALRQAESLINAGQHQEARAILDPLEADYIGDPRYDYLAGLALLETGESGRAVLALERAIAADPRFAGARLDLARAYYASGSYGEARREFETLRDENPPPAARRAIDDYLALIANRQRRLRMEYRLGSRAGYDSNANSATAENDFLGFDLIERSRETSSPFGEVSGGITLLKPLSRRLLLDTRLNLRQRNNPDASFVNSRGGDISVGLRRISERSRQSLRLQTYRVDVDGEKNSDGVALSGSWDRQVRRNLRLGLLGRLGQVRFGEELRVKDANQILAGLTARWSFGGGRGEVGGSLLAGSDDPRESESRYARDLLGLRFDAGWNFGPQFRAQFTAGLMESDYDSVFFEQEFDSPRSDTLTNAAIRLDWRISPKWLMSHVVAYTNNDTDVKIFAYERVETSLSFNRYWR